MTTQQKENFLNGWDLKTIITIITIIVTGSFFFAKLEAKIESNYTLTKMEIDYVKDNQLQNKNSIEREIAKLQSELAAMRNYLNEQSKNKLNN